MSFDPTEKYQSQIPALQLLVALGFTPLSQKEALALRGGRLRNVILDAVLAEQLLRINRYTHRGRTYPFDLEDAHEAIRRLKPAPDRIKGLHSTNQDIYDALLLGTAITRTIDGDSKSYSFRFVDWEQPDNNVFHVSAEFSVACTVGSRTNRCDLVAFVNGIPFVVIENKRPTESLDKADSQLIGYQNADNVPQLFHFAHLLMSMNRGEARYATVGTPRRFWQTWRDAEDEDGAIAPFANRELTEAEKDAVFAGDLAAARSYFEVMPGRSGRAVTAQDRTLFALCRPARLLDLVRCFTVFDAGERKVARHQQFFGVRAAVERARQFDPEGRRKGGVVWHTQGSGKSLTMVMLGRALALDSDIPNPRLIIVTDRNNLDRQIRDTFRSCEMSPVRATSGARLAELIRNKAPLVTTIINKFDTVMRSRKVADDDPNVFVLVDESHRSQAGRYGGHGEFARKMRGVLPSACYLGFTGTPLLQKERNTLSAFGGLIHTYTIDEAVADGAVVPLLYEGRMVDQQVAGDTIDRWFDKLGAGLTEHQKADLKRKFSRMNALAKTSQAIHAKALDISEHYRRHWQGTGFKAQLAAPSKAAAIRFKAVLDDIGHVSSEVVISPPNDNEGREEVDRESRILVQAFWRRMMARYRTEGEYNRQLIDAFKGAGKPEVLIVVSKLLTGFDAPRNTVLYVCKPLREHNLLQAIARVNRLYKEGRTEKEFGFIIDYEGLLGELDQALTTYSAFEGFEAADLIGVLHDVREQIRKLPHHHGRLWDVFRSVRNKQDMELFEQFLADEATRQVFHERLRAFSRCLHLALSSEKLDDVLDEGRIETMKRDWTRFSELRHSVRIRYQETVDVRAFEPQIRKLLDDHVTAMPAETVVALVNLNDPDALKAVVADGSVSYASRADRIASATRRTLTERMEEDPAFYRRFSDLLDQTIRAYREKRLSERDYLAHVHDLAGRVARMERGGTAPESIRNNEDGQAFFGILDGTLGRADGAVLDPSETAGIALALIDLIKCHHIVDVWSNDTAQNNMRNAIDDYFFDVLRGEKGIALSVETMDDLEGKILKLARARFPG
jgi:type I restriction enzyme R subunit